MLIRFGFAECFTSYVYYFWERLRALCWNVTRHEGGHSHASLLVSLSRAKQRAHPFRPGSGCMGAPRMFVRSPKNVSASIKRFDTLVHGNVRVIPQFPPELQFQELSLLHEVTQAAKLQLHARELLPLRSTAAAVKDLKEDLWKQSSAAREIYEMKNLREQVPVALAKLAHVHWRLKVPLIFFNHAPRNVIYVFKMTPHYIESIQLLCAVKLLVFEYFKIKLISRMSCNANVILRYWVSVMISPLANKEVFCLWRESVSSLSRPGGADNGGSKLTSPISAGCSFRQRGLLHPLLPASFFIVGCTSPIADSSHVVITNEAN